ncbi:MAG: hypothetical protein V1859_04360 [archaeon]
MPIYKYICAKCGKIEELFCSFSQKEDKAKHLICGCGSNDFTEKYCCNIAGKSGSQEIRPENSSGSCGGSCSSGSCRSGCCGS